MPGPTYRLRFWGVRGTVATPAADRLGHGGNTPCAAVELADDAFLVLDCGTGFRSFGAATIARRGGKPTRFDVFLSHYHLDHLEGLPLFPPLYDPAATVVFHGAAPAGKDLRATLTELVAPPYFPVRLANTPATIRYETLDGASIRVGDLVVDTIPLRHPDGSTAYRLDHAGTRVVFATDHEHGDEAMDAALVEFSRGAKYLIYDATYMEAEYESLRKGWGHSTWYAAVGLARRAEVERLVLFHHHPEHTDGQLEEIERIAGEELPGTVSAREGMELPF